LKATEVLKTLIELGAVRIDKLRLENGQQRADIFREKINLPIYLAELDQWIKRTNSKAQTDPSVLQYPAIQFQTYDWRLRLNTTREKDRNTLSAISQPANSKSAFWLPRVNSQTSVDDEVVELSLTSYEVRVEIADVKMMAPIRTQLSKLLGTDVLLHVPLSVNPDSYKSAISFVDSKSYTGALQLGANEVDDGAELSVGCVLQRCQPPSLFTSVCPPDQCGKVAVLDQSADRQHPEISSALLRNGLPGPALPLTAGRADPQKHSLNVKNFADGDHATHLVGLISARNNGFGIVGINPHALIENFDWNTFSKNTAALAAELDVMPAPHSLATILFANSWQLEVDVGEDKDYDKDPLLAYIRRNTSLWIVAAGQCKLFRDGTREDCPNGVDVSKKSARAPVNIAQSPNVLVVSSCEDCYDSNAHLTPGANWSKTHVQVAAPGQKLFSTLSGSNFGFADGTSQASALVAGVVSAMVESSSYYSRAEQLKRRLQVTSFPLDGVSIATGAVDLRAALLDPRKHYFIPESGDATGEEAPYQQLEIKGWCSESRLLRFTSSGTQYDIPSTEIRRLIRRGNNWTLYRSDVESFRDGRIVRVGPGQIEGDPCVVLQDNSKFSVISARDIIFADQWKPVSP